MKKKFGLVLVAACVAGTFSVASLAVAETAAPVSGTVAAAAVQVSATVLEIDHATRSVTLKAADGREESFIVDEAVKNLGQVNKGDVVTVTYAESLAYEVKKGGASGSAAEVAVGAGTAQPGEKPAGVVAREVTVTVTITAIDETAPTVTFTGPQGNARTVKVNDPAKLKDVKVGDQVDITYTQAIALSVEKAPAK